MEVKFKREIMIGAVNSCPSSRSNRTPHVDPLRDLSIYVLTGRYFGLAGYACLAKTAAVSNETEFGFHILAGDRKEMFQTGRFVFPLPRYGPRRAALDAFPADALCVK